MALMFALLSSLATASPLVVRFDSAGAAPAEPLLATLVDGETRSDVALRDDGERPDFQGEDSRFAGVIEFAGARATLVLSAGGIELGSAVVEFADPTSPHDVDLSISAGALTASVSSPPDPTGAAPPPGTGEPGAAGGGVPPAAGGAAGRQPVSFASGDSQDGLLLIGVGVGLLALLGAGWIWRRWSAAPRSRSAEVQIVPEPGLLTPSFPSLSDGLAAWVAPADARGILEPLLRHLADRHRVLVAAPADVEVKPVAGGPVYRIVGLRPSLVGDVAESLGREPGPPLCVLLVLDEADADALRDYRDLLPQEVGGLVLLGKEFESGLPTVVVAVVPEGWSLRHGAVTITAAASRRGLDVV
ncbi:MAG: hypothetical protein EXR71_17815 [Myxococcales bacterium]|nr:hypothetical protein [Myxococcales bacterium]